MKKSSLLVVSILFALISANAQKPVEINLVSNIKGFALSESSNTNLVIKTGVNTIKFTPKKTKQGNFVELNSAGLVKVYDEGKPNLPVFSKLIEVPFGAKVSYKIISYDQQIIDLSKYGIEDQIIPAIPSVSKSDDYSKINYKRNEQAYFSKSGYKPETVFYEEAGTLRNIRLGRIQINPFAYNASKNTLTVLNNLVVEITFSEADFSKTDLIKSKYSSPYFSTDITENKIKVNSKALITDAPVTYVIVSDRMFQAQLDPFIAWKKLKGFHVITAYTDVIGNSTTNIKSYLKNLYENPEVGVNPPSFILLVGDVAQIPAWFVDWSPADHYTDLRYAEYTGDDLPEVFIGRFSAQTTEQLQPQIDKTLEYEKYLMPDPAYLGEVLLVPGDDSEHELTWGNGQINYGTTYYFNSNNDIYSHTFLQDYPTGDAAVHDSIIANINKGVALANYTAHCSTNGWSDPSFSVSDVYGLTNAHKYGLLIGNCCQSLTYFNSETFGESVLRKENAGAVGYIGCSNSSYWDEDYWWGVGLTSSITANPAYDESGLGAYDGVFHNLANEINDISRWYVSQSQIIKAGNLAVQASTSNYKKYYWEIYNLMGDPSLVNYLGIPLAQTVTLNPETLTAGSDSVSVSVSAAPYSYIAFTQDEELIGVAMADETGNAYLTFLRALSENTITLVVTAQNKQPYVQELTPIIPDQPYVTVFASSTNPEPENGKTVLLNVTLKNLGNTGYDAVNVNATVSTSDTYVTITDSTENYGSIAAGTEAEILGAFEFTLSDTVPNGHELVFNTEITADGGYTWSKTIKIIAEAPVIEFEFDSINDVTANTVSGNSNGIIDPGEIVEIVSTITNSGDADLINTSIQISSESAYVILNTPELSGINIPAGQTANITVNAEISVDAPLGESLYFKYIINSGLFSAEKNQMLNVGLFIEDFESAGFNSFPWKFAGNVAWTVDATQKYEGNYSAKSGKINDDQSSSMTMNLIIPADDEISFYSKVSSENTYDFLRFSDNGIVKDSWSGEQNWAKHSYPLAAGSHSFKWEYEKDVSVFEGSDCAWVDYITFPYFDKNIDTKNIEKLQTQVYPNPNSGTFYVKTVSEGVSEVEISDITGRTVYKKSVSGEQIVEININNSQSGVYFVKIKSNEGIFTNKIVLE